MARTETIILGGGIAATLPFTVGTLPVIVSTTPPSISDSVYKQSVPNGRSLSMGAGASFGTGDGQVAIGWNCTIGQAAIGQIAIGSNISMSIAGGGFPGAIAIGNNITFGTNTNDLIAIYCGTGALAPGAGTTGIVIGDSAGFPHQSVVIGTGGLTTTNGISRTTLVGYGIFCSSGAGSDNTIIGAQAQVGGQAECTVMGSNAGVQAGGGSNGAIAIGYAAGYNNANAGPSIIIGRFARNQSQNQMILLAPGINDASLPNNTAAFGGPTCAISTVVIGSGSLSASPLAGVTVMCTGGQGTDIAAGSLTLRAPVGTGQAAGGAVDLVSTLVSVVSSATPQTARVGLRVLAGNTNGESDVMIYDVQAAGLTRIMFGAADSGGVGFRQLIVPN